MSAEWFQTNKALCLKHKPHWTLPLPGETLGGGSFISEAKNDA